MVRSGWLLPSHNGQGIRSEDDAVSRQFFPACSAAATPHCIHPAQFLPLTWRSWPLWSSPWQRSASRCSYPTPAAAAREIKLTARRKMILAITETQQKHSSTYNWKPILKNTNTQPALNDPHLTVTSMSVTTSKFHHSVWYEVHYYLCLVSEGIVMLGVTLSCARVTVCPLSRFSLSGEGNALYPVLYR